MYTAAEAEEWDWKNTFVGTRRSQKRKGRTSKQERIHRIAETELTAASLMNKRKEVDNFSVIIDFSNTKTRVQSNIIFKIIF